ncbi:hypothetical protein MNBD_NITROSPINAE03-1963 [hydrothermal vent metagenome]|uniref:Uncharacterized protein n=1 Tax=hydrothermal vent metagenome TaxID=652676 RepID=A0A3B1C973_9ZZZZ
MAVIVDASIQGKLQFPIMSNVVTGNDKPDFGRGTSQMINVTDKNASKINQAKGVPAIPAQVKGQSEGAKQGQAVARANSVSVGDAIKGQNINATA